MSSYDPGGRVETWFVIPLLRNSDRRPHVARLWRLLREELYRAASGESRKLVVLEDVDPSPGSWRDPATGTPVHDESRKYTVMIEREKADTVLRAVLERAANSFDQDEILFVVQGVDRSIKRDVSKGYLRGDPVGG